MTEDSNDQNLNHLNDDKIHKFTKLLPKLELHAHLNGCIRESTLLELLEQEKVPLTPDLIDLLHIHGSTDSNDSNGTLQKNEHFHYNHRQRSLSQCFQIFPLIHQSVCTVLSLERITREALEDFANENVSYLELRSTPRCLQKSQNLKDQQCSKQEYIRTILHVFQEFQEKEWKRYHEEITSVTSMNSIEDSPRPPLIPRLLISIDRSGTVEEAIENVNLAIELYQSRNDFVVGIDLGGNPLKNEFQDFEPVLQLARAAGLKASIHCGEVPYTNGNNYEKEASDVLQFRPDRLGHALFLPPTISNELYRDPIPIECCPTSNTMTLELNFPNIKDQTIENAGDMVHGLKQHPQLSEWIQKNYPLSICTDDSGIFHTNCSLEYYRFMKAFDIHPKDVGNIAMGTIEHIFEGDMKINTNKSILGSQDTLSLKSFLKENMKKRISELVHWME